MRPGFVVDNSVVMGWCFEDENDDHSLSVLEALNGDVAAVPAIWPLEVGNVLVVAEQKKRITRTDAARFLSLLQDLPIVVDQESPERMFQEILALARTQKLSTYDASYLDLAMRLGLPLASRDAPLMRAAARCGVPRFRPSR